MIGYKSFFTTVLILMMIIGTGLIFSVVNEQKIQAENQVRLIHFAPPANVELARLLAPDGAGDDRIGRNVAISGNTIIVGTNTHDIGANPDQGAAYVFVRSGTTWMFQQKLPASDAQANDQFGWSVAVSGNTAIIGAPFEDNATRPDDGSAYVFTRTGTSWTLQQKLFGDSDNPGGEDFFGQQRRPSRQHRARRRIGR